MKQKNTTEFKIFALRVRLIVSGWRTLTIFVSNEQLLLLGATNNLIRLHEKIDSEFFFVNRNVTSKQSYQL